ncbi:MAG: aminoacyl-tRNA hydrolase [Gammaproteobacteria bacterium]|jgi:PTH1 family peptidyl-tRNA hydrolase|nr:aminoacyl-tRNA hydrolase [Gammaproteobacteria bacterium]
MAGEIDLIVGLGNPGSQYARTRHNVGFWLLDQLAASGADLRVESKFQAEVGTLKFGGRRVALLKPTTYMNLSGQAVGAYARYYKIQPAAILVVHDELDLAPGTVRLKRGGGHGGHNGLRDITAQIGAEFLRLRLGIGHPGSADKVVEYVLGNPPTDDRLAIEDAISRGLLVMPEIVAGQTDKIMNQLNRRAGDTGKH